MPQVSDDFIKSAQMLSKAVPALLSKLADSRSTVKEASVSLRVQAEVVADTLVEQGLIKASEKSAAVTKLANHQEALSVLNLTAQKVVANSLGGPEKKAAEQSTSGGMRESDRMLLGRLGLSV